MKRLLLASVGLVALGIAVPASAADLPRRGPAVAPVAVAPIYNWTGFYIGGHIGWGQAEHDVVFDPIFGFGTTTLSGDSADGFLGGGQVGFNWQTGVFVFGVEGQFSWTDLSRSDTFLGATFTRDVNWLATIAGRLGIASANWLFYAKGGVAFMDWDASLFVPGFGTGSVGDTETGWMVGVGIEYGFTPNWSAKIEYNFNRFEDVAGGFFAGTGIHNDVDIHVVKGGINYRFAPVVAPVVARY
jgi:outer membrane immunogenic protein